MKETLKRTLRTFIQAAAGYIIANLALLPTTWDNMNVVKTAITGIVVSAIAAVMNLPTEKDSI